MFRTIQPIHKMIRDTRSMPYEAHVWLRLPHRMTPRRFYEKLYSANKNYLRRYGLSLRHFHLPAYNVLIVWVERRTAPDGTELPLPLVAPHVVKVGAPKSKPVTS